jgi:AraC-like DNA-binding protein
MQYLHVIGSFQGLLLAGLLIFGAKTSTASRILGTWCLFLGLYLLGPFIYLDRELNDFSFLLGLHMFLPASFGAFLYLYCRHALIEHPLALKDLWHFIPLLLCYVLNIELYLSSPEVKLDALLHGPKNLTHIIIAQIILALQAFIYLGLSMALIRRYQNQAEHTLSSYNPEVFSWLWKILILDLLIWGIKGVAGLTEHNAISIAVSNGLIVVLIYSIAMAQWRNQNLFTIAQLKISDHGQDEDNAPKDAEVKLATRIDANIDESIDESIDNNSHTIDASPTDNSGALDPSIRSSLLKVVREHMQEHQTYLDNQLTLTRLAETVGISTHHLSEVLNQHGGKNFYQFVNEYRINYICERLKNDKDIKILDLAMSAGFSSKSTFNAVFKQFVHLTPSQYRQQLIS